MGSPIIQPGDPDWVISTMMAGRDSEGNFRNTRIDDDGDLVGITRPHMEVHQGNYWTAAVRLDAVANDASVYLLIEPATKEAHTILSLQAGAACWADLFLAPTITGVGTEITPMSHNRVIDVAPVTKIYHTPTIGAVGTPGPTFLITGGEKTTAVGGGLRSGDEMIFAPGTKTLMRITSKAGAAVVISVGFSVEWYEED